MYILFKWIIDARWKELVLCTHALFYLYISCHSSLRKNKAIIIIVIMYNFYSNISSHTSITLIIWNLPLSHKLPISYQNTKILMLIGNFQYIYINLFTPTPTDTHTPPQFHCHLVYVTVLHFYKIISWSFAFNSLMA